MQRELVLSPDSLPQGPQCGQRGSNDAQILIVGEAPGENEVSSGKPFVGHSGLELEKMLREGGINPGDIRYDNVCPWRPPGKGNIDQWFPESKKAAEEAGAIEFRGRQVCPPIIAGVQELEKRIDGMPNLRLIIPVGNTALWACTEEYGVTKWRGSQLFSKRSPRLAVVPALHPASILRNWEDRWNTVLDFKRASRWLREGLGVPKYEFYIRPSLSFVLDFIGALLAQAKQETIYIASDIETRARHIVCIGIADSDRRCLCIPFLTVGGPYWSQAEEIAIISLLCDLLMHPNVRVIGQNYSYDRYYIARRWFFRSKLTDDTMIKHHLCFPGVPKGLDFISSIYNHFHAYWKDESKEWDPHVGEAQLWTYNCKDGCATFEASHHIDGFIKQFGHEERLAFQMRRAETAFNMMMRGCRVDFKAKQEMSDDIARQMSDLKDYVNTAIGKDVGVFTEKGTSPKQVMRLAYDVLKLPPIYRERAKGVRSLTADDEAIEEWLRTCNPLYRPVLQAIADYRSLLVYKSTFADANIDPDGRFRCEIKVAGPHTFRWATGSDPFGFGTNMQNIPHGDED